MRVGPHTLAAATSPPPGLVRFQVAAILSATGVLSILNHLFRACKPALLSSDRAKHRWDRLMAIVSFADEMVRREAGNIFFFFRKKKWSGLS